MTVHWTEETYLALGETDARIELVNGAPHEATLVVEITSPGNAVVDRTLKPRLYAEALIDWYLLAEPDFAHYESLTLQLLRREGSDYVTHAEAGPGQTLTSDEPFPPELDTAALLEF